MSRESGIFRPFGAYRTCDLRIARGGGANEGGAGAWMRFDEEEAADHAGAVVHDAEAHPLCVVSIRGDAEAVVANGQEEFLGSAFELDGYLAGFAVANGVADGFLRNTENVSRGGGVRDQHWR